LIKIIKGDYVKDYSDVNKRHLISLTVPYTQDESLTIQVKFNNISNIDIYIKSVYVLYKILIHSWSSIYSDNYEELFKMIDNQVEVNYHKDFRISNNLTFTNNNKYYAISTSINIKDISKAIKKNEETLTKMATFFIKMEKKI